MQHKADPSLRTIDRLVQSRTSAEARGLAKFLEAHVDCVTGDQSTANVYDSATNTSYKFESDTLVEFLSLAGSCAGAQIQNSFCTPESVGLGALGVVFDRKLDDDMVLPTVVREMFMMIANSDVKSGRVVVLKREPATAYVLENAYTDIRAQIVLANRLNAQDAANPDCDIKLCDDSSPSKSTTETVYARAEPLDGYLLGSCEVGGKPWVVADVYRVRQNGACIREEYVPTVASLSSMGGLTTGVFLRMSNKAQLAIDASTRAPGAKHRPRLDYHAAFVLGLLRAVPPTYTQTHEDYINLIATVTKARDDTPQSVASPDLHYRQACYEFAEQLGKESTFDADWKIASELIECKHGSQSREKNLRYLCYIVSSQSGEVYRELKKHFSACLLRDAMYKFDGIVGQSVFADILAAEFGDNFITDKVSEYVPTFQWYEFVSSESRVVGQIYKWRNEQTQPDAVFLQIPRLVTAVYDIAISELDSRASEAARQDNQTLVKYFNKIRNSFTRSISKIMDHPVQCKVAEQLCFRLRCRGFTDELDKNPNVLGVGNGVLLLGANPQLIIGNHEFKITKYTPTKYYPYDPTNPYVQRVEQIFRDVLVEPDAHDFILKYQSTALDGHLSQNYLLTIRSNGSYGKTTIATFVNATLGDKFSAALKPGLLIGPIEDSNNANSAQMQAENKRNIYYDEFPENAVLNDQRLKMMVGIGYQSGRDLHLKQKNFRITANSVAYMNYPLIIKTFEHSTWRRILYYEPKTQFLPADRFTGEPGQKLMDETIEKLPDQREYREATLSILAHWYSKFITEDGGLIRNIPKPTIDRETETYRDSQDTINKFIKSMMVFSPDSSVLVDLVAKKYVESNVAIFRDSRQLPQYVVNAFLVSRLQKYVNVDPITSVKTFCGCRLKVAADEIIRPGETYIGSAPKSVNVDADVKLCEELGLI